MDRSERGLGQPARAARVTGADGSLYYDSRPLPGMPGGGPREADLGWGPEFGGGDGFQFGHGGPPRRRPNGLAAGLLVLGGLAVLIIVVALALRDGDQATVSPVPEAGQATSGRPDDSTPAGRDRPSRDGAQIVATDALYSVGPLDSVGCREQQAVLNKQSAVQAYYSNLVACLNETWAGKIGAAQHTFTPPQVMFWSGYLQSRCGIGPVVAFYCGADRTLYFRYDDVSKAWNRSANSSSRELVRMRATGTAARLFGQHVQQLTGILAAAQRLEYDAPDAGARLGLSRRTELQASCLGAAFVGANKRSYGVTGHKLTIYRRYVATGEPLDQSSRTNRQYWAQRGFNTTDSAYCNTFRAATSKVS